MRRYLRWSALLVSVVALAALALPASAGHATDPRTPNMRPLGHIEEPASLIDPAIGNTDIHTDIAFQQRFAFQGNWDGFNIRDISDPRNPTTVSRTFCDGNQGDIVVFRDILVRSWNTPAGTAGVFGAGLTCDGQPVPEGFEGVHVFDISDPTDPVLVGAVETECGSHTATLVPDLPNNRAIVYSNVSSGCDFIDIIEVPLDDPGNASLLRTEPLVGGSLGSNNGCHDMAVILGHANLAVCASGHAANVFDIGPNAFPGGSLEDPAFLYTIEEADGLGNQVGVGGRWHSAAFTWDGKVIVLGWEPGGGVQAECEAGDPDIKKSVFFYDSATGAKLGQWTLPRPQSATENCTIHNYNVVPLADGRYLLAQGSYQSGTSLVDFTDPANPVEIAWSDPPAIPVVPGSPFCSGLGCEAGGAWSSYWYNNFLYETNITEGLNIFRVTGNVMSSAVLLNRLNPQTQEFTLDAGD